jgi:hypothetical protein
MMARPGRKPAPLPPGVRRIEKRRHEIRIWLDDAPDDPPTVVWKQRASKRPVGRPSVSADQSKKLLRLRIATAIRQTRGESLKSALYDAMRLLKWPDQRAAEHKRLAERFRVGHMIIAAKKREVLLDPDE